MKDIRRQLQRSQLASVAERHAIMLHGIHDIPAEHRHEIPALRHGGNDLRGLAEIRAVIQPNASPRNRLAARTGTGAWMLRQRKCRLPLSLIKGPRTGDLGLGGAVDSTQPGKG